MTTAQVARRLGISQQHVIRLAKAGVLQHERTPLGRLYDVECVERVAQERDRVKEVKAVDER